MATLLEDELFESESGDEVSPRSAETRTGTASSETSTEAHFPMYVVSVKDLLTFDVMPTHENLLVMGLLKNVEEGDIVHFVSQRWLSWEHPDPHSVKLRLFQRICRQILHGDPRSLFDPHDWEVFATGSSLAKTFQALSTELTQDAQQLDPESFKQSIFSGYVWWDYISVPQMAEDTKEGRFLQELAIFSIPHYIERSAYFWVVVPEALHADTKAVVSYEDWQTRGWCRLEEWGNFLSKRVAPPLIVTEAPHIHVVDTMDFLSIRSGIGGMARHAVCEGCFSCCEQQHRRKLPSGDTVTIRCDKLKIERILAEMLAGKIEHYRQTGKEFMRCFVRNCAYSVYAGSCFGSRPKDVPQLLLDVRADGVHDSYEGLTPLTWACTYGCPFLVRALLKLGARADQTVTILQCAAQRGNVEVLQLLLNSGQLSAEALCRGSPKANITGLDRGAKCGKAEAVRCLLTAKASPHAVRKDNGQTPLHTAAESGFPGVCKALLEARATANAVDSKGRTPLMLAGQRLTLFGRSAGKAACARLLLSASADPSLRDDRGRTAGEVASEDDHKAFLAVIGSALKEPSEDKIESS